MCKNASGWHERVQNSKQSNINRIGVTSKSRPKHRQTAATSSLRGTHWRWTQHVHWLTAFCRVNATRSIAADAQKTDMTLTPGGHHFGFCYSLSRHYNARTGLLTLLSCWVRINHAPATRSTPAAPASVWTMHRPYWPHRPYTLYMAILYTKQGAVKLSQMLMKSTHHHWLPQQTRIGRQTAQTSNMV